MPRREMCPATSGDPGSADRRPIPLVVPLTALEAGAVLGEGGQGRVAELRAEHQGLVMKIYRPEIAVNAQALTRLVAWRRSLDADQRFELDHRANWPVSVVVSDDRAVGVVLPRVGAPFLENLRMPSGAVRAVLREAQYLIADDRSLARRGLGCPTMEVTLAILEHIARSIAFVHGLDIVVGDLSTKNILWGTEPPRTLLMDCDGMRLIGTEPAVKQADSPGWRDPAFVATQNQRSDLFKLGLLVTRAIERDFQLRSVGPTASSLGGEIVAMLDAALGRDPDARPSAAAWAEVLSSFGSNR